MSSIIRRRRGLIVAIWGSCPDEGRCDHPHPLRQDASAQHPRRPSRAAGSFNPHSIKAGRPRQIRQNAVYNLAMTQASTIARLEARLPAEVMAVLKRAAEIEGR